MKAFIFCLLSPLYDSAVRIIHYNNRVFQNYQSSLPLSPSFNTEDNFSHAVTWVSLIGGQKV